MKKIELIDALVNNHGEDRCEMERLWKDDLEEIFESHNDDSGMYLNISSVASDFTRVPGTFTH